MEDSREDQAKDIAAAYKGAKDQLDIALGTVKNKTMETALRAWQWARLINEIHGTPQGIGSRASSLSHEQLLAYCSDLGLSTKVVKDGRPSGSKTIGDFRFVAARVATEEHLRELVHDLGGIWAIAAHLHDANRAKESRDKNARQQRAHKRPSGYNRFVPPQSWTSFFIQRGLNKGQIGAAMAITLEAFGAEESFRLWEDAGQPGQWDEANRYQYDV